MLLQGEFNLCIVCEELGRALGMTVKPPKVSLGCEGQEWVEDSERQCKSRRISQRCQESRTVMDVKKMEQG